MEYFDINEFIYDDIDNDHTINKINIMCELGYEAQIDEDSIYETFYNLYHYFKKANTIIKDLGTPFYEDMIVTNIENYFDIKINDEDFYKDLEIYLENKFNTI